MLIASFAVNKRSSLTSAYCCGMWHLVSGAGRGKESSQTTSVGCQTTSEAVGRQNSGIPPHGWLLQKCGKGHLNAENMRFWELSINSFIMQLSKCLNLWEVSKLLFSLEWINGWYKTWPVCFYDFFQFPEEKDPLLLLAVIVWSITCLSWFRKFSNLS